MNDADLLRLLSLASQTAKDAAETVRDGREYRRVLTDLPRDVKIDADHRLEEFIVKRLRKEAEYPVLSEETGVYGGKDMKFNWIVDPLDGSLNFSRGIPLCCISIALWMGREPVLGVVFDFNRNELFAGAIGIGAWLNGVEMRVSAVDQPQRAVLCTGFPADSNFSEDSLHEFVRDVRCFKKVRLLGSAALSLTYLASGRADFYREDNIKLWDVAAGLALVRAAGGAALYTASCDEVTFHVKASNGILPL